ncbi:MAG: hypothetical protein COA32_06475 [Fluviicola sp.]|nr:MAG: hypothetical protein COA32_06475 [Fluviicola sp.]
MMIKMNVYKLAILTLLCNFFYGCWNDSNRMTDEISEDIVELGEYIDLETYKPLKVKWTYDKMGGQTESRTLGPNDYVLKALLYFDKEIIIKLKNDYNLLSVSINGLKKDQLSFEWLNTVNRKKLESSKDLIYYHPEFFKKGSLIHGGYTIIDENTVLLTLHTM